MTKEFVAAIGLSSVGPLVDERSLWLRSKEDGRDATVFRDALGFDAGLDFDAAMTAAIWEGDCSRLEVRRGACSWL